MAPAHQCPLRADVSDVEDGAQPIVSPTTQVNSLFQTSELRVAEIESIENSQTLKYPYKWEKAIVEFPMDSVLFLLCEF